MKFDRMDALRFRWGEKCSSCGRQLIASIFNESHYYCDECNWVLLNQCMSCHMEVAHGYGSLANKGSGTADPAWYDDSSRCGSWDNAVREYEDASQE